MPTPNSDNAAWVEILAPLAPPPLFSTWQLVLLASILLSLMLLVLYWWWRQPRQQARWQLRVLLQQVDHTGSDLRQLGLQLRGVLCLGWRVTNLVQVSMAPTQQVHWQDYYATLTQLCYQPQPPTAMQLRELLHQARDWLRQSPTAHVR